VIVVIVILAQIIVRDRDLETSFLRDRDRDRDQKNESRSTLITSVVLWSLSLSSISAPQANLSVTDSPEEHTYIFKI